MKRLGISIVVIGVFLAAWFWYIQPTFFPPSNLSADPQVAELQLMQKKIVEQVSSDSGQVPDEDHMRTMGEKIRELSDEQRREFFRSSRDNMMVMMEARMKRFFTLSPEEQKKQLDEDIDRMQKMRGSGRGFGGGRRGGGEGSKEGERKQGQAGEQNQNAQSGESDRAPRKRYSEMTDEEKNARRRSRLNHSTPERRAMFAEYRSRMHDRMRERGITPPSR